MDEHIQLILQPEISDSAFSELRRKLVKERGLDLNGYKDRCIRRRIAVRLRAMQCSSLEGYLKILLEDPQELDRLIQAVTINVSGFFRNQETFELIRERILPSIIAWRNANGEKELNIWSAGCATGEEVYSLAIMLRQYFRGAVHSMRVFIVATDINESFLARARQGIYSHERLEAVPPSLRKRYFREREGSLELIPRIREMVSFEKQDLFEPCPFRQMDLILCRNVLIYLSRMVQEKIFRGFHEALRPEGFLVLGKTESLLEPVQYGFRSILPRERAYQKVALS